MSIIKDGKVYRTLEEQVYHLTKEFKEVKSAAEDIDSKIAGKQDTLDTSTLPTAYTQLNKVIGFDDQNKLAQEDIASGISNNNKKVARSGDVYNALQSKQNILTESSTTERALTKFLGFTSGGILGRNDIDTSPSDFVNHLITSKGVKDALKTKQDKLTSESLEEGTLDKAVGFDSQGNLIKGIAQGGGGTDDYDDLDNKPIINQIEQSVISQFVNGQTIDNGNIVHFDLTKGSVIESFLDSISYTSEGGMVEYLVAGDRFILAAYNLSSMSMGKVIILIDREGGSTTTRVIYGTTAGDVGEFAWQAGFNNLDENGDFTISLEQSETIYVNQLAGWNGIFVSLKATTLTPVPENGNYYRKPDGKIYYYSSNTYNKITTNDDLDAINSAIEEKQDIVSQSSVNYGVANEILGLDGSGNLVRDNLPSSKTLYRHNLSIYANSSFNIRFTFINDSNTLITDYNGLTSALSGKGTNAVSGMFVNNSNQICVATGLQRTSSNFILYGTRIDTGYGETSITLSSSTMNISDNVKEL